MIAQWAKGLDEPVQKDGCLFLCYLWAGWLWALRDRDCMQETAYPTVEVINDTHDFLRLNGSIGEDCFVRQPDNVVSFPWHYWDDCQLPGAAPVVKFEKVSPADVQGVPPAASGLPLVGLDQRPGMVVDITRWRFESGSHFTGACKDPWGYFDPWVRSTIARHGIAKSVRRVSVVPE